MDPQAILTVDLEDWHHANYDSLPADVATEGRQRNMPRQRASGATAPAVQSRVVEHTQILLEIFQRQRVHATFFTLGIVAREHPELLRTIVREGHEIACHGDAHAQVSRLSPDGFRDDLRRARDAIHQACGSMPRGFRAPSWSISPPSWEPHEAAMWPLQILAEEGFTYDASLFPFKTYLYGVRGAPTCPHRIDLPSGASIFELPAASVELGGRRWPFGGGFYFRLLPLFMTRFLGRRYLKQEAEPFMFYIHPREISTDQPRLELALKERFIHTFNLGRNRRKLERLLEQLSCCTAADYLSRRRDSLPLLEAVGDAHQGGPASPPRGAQSRSVVQR